MIEEVEETVEEGDNEPVFASDKNIKKMSDILWGAFEGRQSLK